jgi:hypothetical protein
MMLIPRARALVSYKMNKEQQGRQSYPPVKAYGAEVKLDAAVS